MGLRCNPGPARTNGNLPFHFSLRFVVLVVVAPRESTPLKRILWTLVEARVRWACMSRTTALLCSVFCA